MNFSIISAVVLALVTTSSYGNTEKKDDEEKRLVLECNVDIKKKTGTIRRNHSVQIILQEGGIYKTIGSLVASPLMYVEGENFPFYMGFKFENSEGIKAGIGWSHQIKVPDYELIFNLNRLNGNFQYYWKDKFTTNEAIGKCKKVSAKF